MNLTIPPKPSTATADCITVTEIAEQAGCTIVQVLHFIRDNRIQPAARDERNFNFYSPVVVEQVKAWREGGR